ncbi:MAG: DUF4349 domain-containing protein [Solobacterium sp.]|nr:DUF4349 domain-containing protein [Solobacterium sp.]
MKKISKGFLFVWILIACVLFVGCGRSSGAMTSDSNSSVPQAAAGGIATYDEKTEEAYLEESMQAIEDWAEEVQTEQKLVYTGSLSIETLKYEDTLKNMRNLIKQYSGIIEEEQESDNAYNWYATDYKKTRGTKSIYLTVRIPTKDFAKFLEEMEGTGKVIQRSTNVENITRRYNSVSTDIESYQIQQKRLLEMMQTAQTVEEMIVIESRLSEVERQLRQSENERNIMDTDVALSTVYIDIREVMEYTPEESGLVISNFWKRLVSTFKWSWEFFIYLVQQAILLVVRIIPFVIVFVPLFFVLRWIWNILPKDFRNYFSKLKIKLSDIKEFFSRKNDKKDKKNKNEE